MKPNTRTVLKKLKNIGSSGCLFGRASLLVFSLLFFGDRICAQVSQDSTAPLTTQLPGDSVSRVRAVPADTTIKRPAKRIAHIKKDTSLAAIDSIDASAKLRSYTQGETLAQYPTDSVPYRYKHLYKSEKENAVTKIISFNSYFNFLGKPGKAYEQSRVIYSYDGLFYLMVAVLFYFALVKVLFAKYMSNLFTLFFRASMRQQQIREQVLQSPLPSLSLNILFVISAGLYASFIVKHYHPVMKIDFWLMFVDFSGLICLIYIGKFLLLKCVGWIFNIQRATDTYIFIVFLTNKMIGIFLLPFLVMLSFSGNLLNEVAITASLIMILTFLAYRWIAAYVPLRKEIKMNGFHFFLYLCAFEIAPVLLIYRVLIGFLGNVWY